jgi:hypothetical protein
MHVVHYAKEVDRFITNVDLFDVGNAPGHAIDCLVSEFFSEDTATRGEDRYQPPANFFVKQPGVVSIGVEPFEQPIEIRLLKISEMLRG